MGMKLYGAALSPFVRKTRVFMQLKGLEFEPVHVDPNNLPEGYERLNPLKRIPALEADGRILADSGVICAYLERTHPEPALYPSDDYDYARALWFEKYADYELGPTCTFTVFRNRVIMPLIGKPCDDDKIRQCLEEKIPPLFAYLDKELTDREYLVGDRLTIADIAVASQLVNFGHGGESVDAGRYPKLAAYAERLHALPPFAKTIEKERAFVEKVRAQ